MNRKKRITIGILAHVDAGKTTLSEALLVSSGALPKAGRVDHGDSFLDTDAQEKRRGITIFSGEAPFTAGDTEVTLVDTPGHVDFSAEMERTLSILDYAVLVVSGRELIQGHTVTIWKLLGELQIPVFIFVNKMDLEGTDREHAMEVLKASLDDGCVCFGDGEDVLPDAEELAMCDEALLDTFLAGEAFEDVQIADAIRRRRIFPCWFGSALQQWGVDGLVQGLDRYTRPAPAGEQFAARVYRISRDRKGTRLTHMKIFGGRIKVREEIDTGAEDAGRESAGGCDAGDGFSGGKDAGGKRSGGKSSGGMEKVHEIRVCLGERFENLESAEAGQVVAVAGLEHTQAGQGLGTMAGQRQEARLQPVLVYSMIPEEGANIPLMMQQMRQLEEEDPQLHVRWNEALQEIQVRLMGEIQLEILQEMIEERFGYRPVFDEGNIEYRETITAPVRGAGHFEPLRHYAEVHLLMEPLEEGSGLLFESHVSPDVLDTNWQRLIMTHLTEREHPGTLVGAPITDMRICIEGGRAHLKHTEGGDFRQATYRAIRQGLRKALRDGSMQLLEPWYAFRLELPRAQAGRAMADVQRMGGSFETEELPSAGGTEDMVLLTGRAPVSQMRGYGAEVASYTKGYGRFACSFDGFSACRSPEKVIEEAGYDPDHDMDHPADSVFCSHGAGRTIPWDEADEMMHVSVGRQGRASDGDGDWDGCGYEYEDEDGGGPGTGAPAGAPHRGSAGASGGGRVGTGGDRASGKAAKGASAAMDKELDRIFERTFGKQEKPKVRKEAKVIEAQPAAPRRTKPAEVLPEYLLVDGYNIIFAWEELRELSKVSIDGAREALIEILSNYQGLHKCDVIVVFDAYRVKGGREHTEKQGGITVVFTAEAETADTYIERAAYAMRKKCRVRVATSDRLEQMIILGNDAFRVSATEFLAEVMESEERMRSVLEEHRRTISREHRNRIELKTVDPLEHRGGIDRKAEKPPEHRTSGEETE